ncbi:unnamed protein product [Ceratitis capitata]|uniref:(Mediterranean fruit fly) hypothetical protein n=1 Tax=Ceratitis capitata TaxID=7213 RepID=A0A811UCF7_CERCA|nr:unnamed protein product [Ceratitis capitata]
MILPSSSPSKPERCRISTQPPTDLTQQRCVNPIALTLAPAPAPAAAQQRRQFTECAMLLGSLRHSANASISTLFHFTTTTTTKAGPLPQPFAHSRIQ